MDKNKIVPKCEVKDCLTNTMVARSRVHYFAFPKNFERRAIWVNNCDLAKSDDVYTKYLQCKYICQYHFENKMFEKVGRILKKDAIPTIFGSDVCLDPNQSLFDEVLNFRKTLWGVNQTLVPRLPNVVKNVPDSYPDSNINLSNETISPGEIRCDLNQNKSILENKIVYDYNIITKSIANNTDIKENISDITKKNSKKKKITLPFVYPNMSSNQSNCTPIDTLVPFNNSYHDTQQLQKYTKSLFITTPTTPQIEYILSDLIQNLTDDMVLILAPSFSVPYVYENKPIESLKMFIQIIEKNMTDNKGDISQNNKFEEDNVFLCEKNENNHKQEEGNKSNNIEKIISKKEINFKMYNNSKNKGYGYENIFINEPDNIKKKYSRPENTNSNENLKIYNKVTNLTLDSNGDKNNLKNPFQNVCTELGETLVKEYVQLELLHTQKKKNCEKNDKYSNNCKNMAISSSTTTFQFTKNYYKSSELDIKQCHLCDFKSESNLVLAHHLESSHTMNNKYYKSNLVSQHNIHKHNSKKHLNSRPFKNQCKVELIKHLGSSSKSYHSKINQGSVYDNKDLKKPSIISTNNFHETSVCEVSNSNEVQSSYQHCNNMGLTTSTVGARSLQVSVEKPFPKVMSSLSTALPNQASKGITSEYPRSSINSSMNTQKNANRSKVSAITLVQQTQSRPNINKDSMFLKCEICDVYINGREQLYSHFNVNHQENIYQKNFVKPFVCPKCPSKFYTDTGLERHLLGSHGLVTCNMKSTYFDDENIGRCPVCHKKYIRNLLKHVEIEHSISLIPFSLSYSCKLCPLTFSYYKHYEKHFSKHAEDVKKKTFINLPVATSSSSAITKVSVYDNKDLKKPSIISTNNFHETSVCEVSNSNEVQSSYQHCNNMGLTTSTVGARSLQVSVEKPFPKVMSSLSTALPNQASKGITSEYPRSSINSSMNTQKNENRSKVSASTPVQQTQSRPNINKDSMFLKCEICDVYINGREQLYSHLNVNHQENIYQKNCVKPFVCPKCPSKFYTDTGLERHLLGSHGLVTCNMQSNMQSTYIDDENIGRCPVCHKKYFSNLLKHVEIEHSIPLILFSLSYSCKLCPLTFSYYKHYEKHFSKHAEDVKKKTFINLPLASSSSSAITKVSVYDNKDLKKPSIISTNNFHETSVCEVSNSNEVQSSYQHCNNMGLTTSTVGARSLQVSVEKPFPKVMSSLSTALPNQASKGITSEYPRSSINSSMNTQKNENRSKVSAITPVQQTQSLPNINKASMFLKCEICDVYINGREQLYSHFNVNHQENIYQKNFVKPFVCPKCPSKFYTDTGLERHLLGSHGLVTCNMQSNMQSTYFDNENIGRCPVCHKKYFRNLLKHVEIEHSIPLIPFSLSYSCKLCPLTFSYYKHYEKHFSKHAEDVKKKTFINLPVASSSSTAMTKQLQVDKEISTQP